MTIQNFNDVSDDTEKVVVDADDAVIICFDARYENYGISEPEVLDDLYETTRWSQLHTRIVKDEKGRYWRVGYSRGSTEMQHEAPFEHDDEVEFRRVYKWDVVKNDFFTKSSIEKKDKISKDELGGEIIDRR